MWAEFVGSLPCSERFFPEYSGFPLSPKTNILIFSHTAPQAYSFKVVTVYKQSFFTFTLLWSRSIDNIEDGSGSRSHDFFQANAKFFTSSSVSSANSEKERTVISKVVVESDSWTALGGD